IDSAPAGNITVVNNTPSIYYNNVTDGAHNWSVSCADGSGNSAQSQASYFTVDNSGPAIALVSPLDGALLSNNTVLFNYSAISRTSAYMECGLWVDGAREALANVSNNTNSANNITLGYSDHFWYVSCTDLLGNNETTNMSYFRIEPPVPPSDNESPYVVGYDPYPNFETYNNNVSFRFLAWDNDALTLPCTTYLDGMSINSSTIGNNTFNQFYRTVQGGSHYWYAVCYDNSSNLGTSNIAFFTVHSDTVPPVAAAMAPANGSIFSSPNVTFNYTVYDDHDASIECNLSLNGFTADTAYVQNNTNYSVTISNIADGLQSWNVTCSDNFANTASTPEMQFYVDTAAPQLALLHPAEGQEYNYSYIDFSYNVTDNVFPNSSCEVFFDGVSAGVSVIPNGTAPQLSYPFNEGQHWWNVTCTDAAGNSNRTGAAFVADFTAPLVNATAPDDLYRTAAPNATFTFIPSDAFTNNISCYLNINNSPTPLGATLSGYSDSFSTPLPEGIYPWSISCVDGAGNTGQSENRTLFMTPNVTALAPADNANISANPANFNFSVVSRNSALLNCSLLVDLNTLNATAAANSASYSLSASDLSQGGHTWQVACHGADLADGYSPSRQFYVDYAAPAVNITYPIDGFTANSNVVEVGYNMSDNSGSSLLCMGVVNGLNQSELQYPAGANSGAANLTFSNGDNSYYISCIDPAGNAGNSSTRLLTADLGYPPNETCYCNSNTTCASAMSAPACKYILLNQSVSNPGNFIGSVAGFNGKTFDCQGYTITGNNSGYGFFLGSSSLAPSSYSTIKNCIMKEYDPAIDLGPAATNMILRNNAISNNFTASLGFGTFNTYGISLDNSSYNRIINTTTNIFSNQCQQQVYSL
ncbi:MAG TPA: hypothetical protein PLO51_00655, partial [Candidatus Micrarchaeota archaeon]|nr:hypothetical protein [Candidatus Micrarchaeota archaeon]